MATKNFSLQSILSHARLREMAGDKVYARGEEYYGRKLVNLLYHAPQEAAAEVEGSHPYRVEIRLSDDKKIEAECTCPAMQDWGFCKHAVAAGLFLIDAPVPTHKNTPRNQKEEKDTFAQLYPNLAGWIKDGHIEIGRDGYSTSMIRVIDEGGVVWEGGTRHKSIDKMLEEAEQAIKEWFDEN